LVAERKEDGISVGLDEMLWDNEAKNGFSPEAAADDFQRKP
jgi:hypothetical protein